MSRFMFATCDRALALGFLRIAGGGTDLQDTPESIGPLLDLIAADVVRVQDPAFHQPAQVVPGNLWDESRRTEVLELCQRMLVGRPS